MNIQCQICNKELKLITHSHLIKHNLTLHEYIELYPNIKITSDELIKLRSEKMSGKNHWNYGRKNSIESNRKNSESNGGQNNHFYGKHHTKETKEILREKNKNKIPWNKGIPRTQEEKDNISKGRVGKLKGISKSEEHKKKISDANKGRLGYFRESNPNWKGGISTLNHLIRTNSKTNEWIKIIFERDNYTCKECGQVGWTLNAHHIKPVHQILKDNNILMISDALNCNELWDISNGITLCKKCHDKINKQD